MKVHVNVDFHGASFQDSRTLSRFECFSIRIFADVWGTRRSALGERVSNATVKFHEADRRELSIVRIPSR
jgi:hypothetical protein